MISLMNRKQRRVLGKIFERPTRADIQWSDLESLLLALGAEKHEGAGSRVRFVFGDGFVIGLHRPHPAKELPKYAVEQLRGRLLARGITPEEA
jgi:hypothetical protein